MAHSRHGHAPMFGPSTLPWVTMAEALGWGLTERPAYVVAGGGNGCGGGLHDGGSRQRAQVAKHQAEGRWRVKTHHNGRVGGRVERFTRDVGRPSPTITQNGMAWCWERPATTVQGDPRVAVQGDPRVAAPGHHEHNRDETSIPVTIAELGVLQGFPADHPWQAPGRSGQVGNAIPPPLAEACLRAVTGITSNARRPEGSAGVDPA